MAAFRSLYLSHYFDGFCFPMVEDLVNQPPFTCFAQWLRSRGLCWGGPLVPMLASPQQRLLARTAEGQQAGALSGEAACPPLLPIGRSCDQHFEGSLALARCHLSNHLSWTWTFNLRRTPWRTSMAACGMCGRAPRALRELKTRWARAADRDIS